MNTGWKTIEENTAEAAPRAMPSQRDAVAIQLAKANDNLDFCADELEASRAQARVLRRMLDEKDARIVALEKVLLEMDRMANDDGYCRSLSELVKSKQLVSPKPPF